MSLVRLSRLREGDHVRVGDRMGRAPFHEGASAVGIITTLASIFADTLEGGRSDGNRWRKSRAVEGGRGVRFCRWRVPRAPR